MSTETNLRTREELLSENVSLHARVTELEQTLRALQTGGVDAITIPGTQGDQIFTLQGAEQIYRVLIEEMNEGAVTVTLDGTVLYCNQRFAGMLGLALSKIIGSKLANWLAPEERGNYEMLLRQVTERGQRAEINLPQSNGKPLEVSLYANLLSHNDMQVVYLVVTDLTDYKLREAMLQNALKESVQARLSLLSLLEDQQATETRLRESETKFATAFHTSPVAMVISRRSDGTFLEFNEELERISGYSRAELQGQSIAKMGLLPDPELRKTLAAQGVFHNLEIQMRHKSGEMRWLNFSVQPIKLKGEECRLAVVQDIHERKRMEQAIHDSDAKFAAAFRTGPLSLGIVGTDRRHVEANQALCDLLGYTREEIIGKTSQELGLLDEAQEQKIQENMVESGGRVYNLETEMRSRDGSIHQMLYSVSPFEVNGVLQFIGMGLDITEHKQAEQKLRESEAQLFTIFHSSPVGIGLSRLSDNAFVNANEALLKIFDLPREEVVGHDSLETNRWYDVEERDQMFSLLRKDGILSDYDIHVRTRSGLERNVQVSAEVIMLANEPHMLGIVHDVTERKQAEEKLRESEKTAQVILNAVTETLFLMDIEGKVLAANATTASRLGKQVSELIGANIYDFIPAENAQTRKEWATKVVNERKGIHHEDLRRGRWLDNYIYPILDEDGQVRRLTIYGQDITERKQVEQELRISEEKYRGLLQSLDSSIIVLSQTGMIEYINETAADLLGHTFGELVGKALTEVFPPPYGARQLEDLQQTLRENRELRTEEQVFLKDGIRWFNTSRIPLHDENGHPTSVLINATDIHELKTIQQQLLEMNQSLEAKVKERSAQWQDLYDNAPVGYHSLDANGNFLTINQTELNWLGYTREEMLGKPAALIFPQTYIGIFNEHFRQIKANGFLKDLEFEVVRKDGSTFPALVNATAMYDTDGNFISSRSTLADITVRKRTEEAMRQSEEKYAALFHKSAVPAILSTFPESLYVDVNEIFTRQYGYTREEMLGKTSLDIGLIRPNVRTQLFEAFKNRGVFTGNEVPVYTKQGEERIVVVNSQEIQLEGKHHIITTAYDVTAQKQAEWALQTSFNRVNALYQISQGSIELIEIPALLKLVAETLVQVLAADRVNILIMDILGRKIEITYKSGPGADQVVDISFEEAWDGLSGWALREQKIAFSPSGSLDDRESSAVQTRRKETNTGDIMVVPLIYQGRPLGTITVINRPEDLGFGTDDMHLMQAIANQMAVALEHIRAQLDLQQVNSELARALRVKDEFLANMSHELRTPLNAINGMSESLLEQYFGELNPKQQKYISTINESGNHLLALINDILDLAKIEAGEITLDSNLVSVDAVCQSSLSLIKELANKKNLVVKYIPDPDVTLVLADARRLKQMLVNFLSNAVKFTPVKGTIGLEVRGQGESNQVTFTVWDTGIGIKEEDIARLFKPFMQVDSALNRAAEGTGLGLALVAQMARLHGGNVSLQSQIGEGSRFTITLPWNETNETYLQDRKTGSLEMPAQTLGRVAQNGQTILLVEDTGATIMIIRDYLEHAGYKVEVAWDGVEAIYLAEKVRPDLILMDVQMPVMDGLEATRILRSRPLFKSTPIIALTALAMPNDRERCLAAGMNEYLSKPVNLKNLRHTILDYLNDKGQEG